MKKNIVLTALCTLLSIQLFAQRYADLGINLTSPAQGDTVWVDYPFTINSFIKNNGVDTIFGFDTLAFQLSFDGSLISFGSTGTDYIDLTGAQLNSGDSSALGFTFGVSQGWPLGITDMCVKVWSLNVIDSLHDTVATNDSSCVQIIVAQKTSSVKEVQNTNGVVSVYPNPAQGTANFKIYIEKTVEATITMTDISGRMMRAQVYTLDAGYNSIPFDVQAYTPGLYMYTITCGAETQRGKLQVR
jgi:hypothetical protein